jgi:hypothetical protein
MLLNAISFHDSYFGLELFTVPFILIWIRDMVQCASSLTRQGEHLCRTLSVLPKLSLDLAAGQLALLDSPCKFAGNRAFWISDVDLSGPQRVSPLALYTPRSFTFFACLWTCLFQERSVETYSPQTKSRAPSWTLFVTWTAQGLQSLVW